MGRGTDDDAARVRARHRAAVNTWLDETEELAERLEGAAGRDRAHVCSAVLRTTTQASANCGVSEASSAQPRGRRSDANRPTGSAFSRTGGSCRTTRCSMTRPRWTSGCGGSTRRPVSTAHPTSSYVRGSRTALGRAGARRDLLRAAARPWRSMVSTSARSRNPATERRRFCPTCGWSRRVRRRRSRAVSPVRGRQAADTGQVLTTLPFRRASAYTSRELALRDERQRGTREDPVRHGGDRGRRAGRHRRCVAAERVPLRRRGAAHGRHPLDNLGPVDRGGAATQIAGHEVTAPRFLACRYCGVVPAAQSGVRETADARHRGWCRQRQEPDADPWVTVVLTHELRTQAVRLLVPPVVVADADGADLVPRRDPARPPSPARRLPGAPRRRRGRRPVVGKLPNAG